MHITHFPCSSQKFGNEFFCKFNGGKEERRVSYIRAFNYPYTKKSSIKDLPSMVAKLQDHFALFIVQGMLYPDSFIWLIHNRLVLNLFDITLPAGCVMYFFPSDIWQKVRSEQMFSNYSCPSIYRKTFWMSLQIYICPYMDVKCTFTCESKFICKTSQFTQNLVFPHSVAETNRQIPHDEDNTFANFHPSTLTISWSMIYMIAQLLLLYLANQPSYPE